MDAEKNLILSNDTMRGLDRIDQKYGRTMLLYTLNGFFIEAGMLPDIPIGMKQGQFKNRYGIWIPGVLYSQYGRWEPLVEDLFDIKAFRN